MKGMEKLAIIGGGAAGLAAAITAARTLRAQGVVGGRPSNGNAVDVVIYEADERVGRSILATGNGRCNFSNIRVNPSVYRNATFVEQAFSALELQTASASAEKAARNPVHEFFSGLGLIWREESEGRLYPFANKASSVLDVLRFAAAAEGVCEACCRMVVRVDAPQNTGGHFHLRFADGAIEHARAVIIATGGRALKTLELPRSLVRLQTQPVLGPLRTDTALTKTLNNIRVRCNISLTDACGREKACENGEVLFRDYGVSGIAVFNLSRFAEAGDILHIDLLPQISYTEIEGFLFVRRKRLMQKGQPPSFEAFLRGMLLPQVARVVLSEVGWCPDAMFEKEDVSLLARALKELPLVVGGIGDARQCQVMCGGLSTDSFNARTMEARAVSGLYAAGEALDVDAPCGGYNLHWAWASGMAAGYAAAYRLADAALGGRGGFDA